jgi:soluble P-type ATPase
MSEHQEPVVPHPRDREVPAASLPVADQSVDLIINRHGGFDAVEVFRVLTPGGTCVTQQVGNQTNREIHDALGAPSINQTYVTLDGMREAASSAGLIVERIEEAVTRNKYMDAGANVDPARVLAVGDAANDVELLTGAAVACAMGDAPPEVLALADHVLPSAAVGGWAAIADIALA